MREIKFRGKRIDNGEWIYGNLVISKDALNGYEALIIPQENADGFTTDYSTNGEDKESYGFDNWYAVIPETVGQYTGLKNKNGKEIYEGDIAREEDGGLFTVKYGEHNTSEWNDTHELGFYVESNSEEEISRAIRTDIIFWVKYRKLEVIGNIHNNPELLEVSHG
jgi:uncharacterized phage protein (TIGR01671 family)